MTKNEWIDAWVEYNSKVWKIVDKNHCTLNKARKLLTEQGITKPPYDWDED